MSIYSYSKYSKVKYRFSWKTWEYIKLQKGKVHILIGEFEKAQNEFNGILDRDGNNPNHSNYCEALYGLSSVALYRGEFEKAREFAFEGLNKYIKINEDGAHRYFNLLGEVEKRLGKYNLALQLFYQALNSVRALANTPKEQEAQILMGIGSVYSNLKDYEKAMEYNQKAFEMMRDTGYKLGMVQVLNNYADVLIFLKRFSEAEDMLREAFKICNEIEVKIYIPNLLIDFGYLFSSKGEFAHAKSKYLEALKESINIGLGYHISLIYFNLANTCKEMLEYDEALVYLEKAIELDMGKSFWYKEALDMKEELSKKINNEKEVL